MAGEYLSAKDARSVELPVLNPFARIRKIREYAGQLSIVNSPAGIYSRSQLIVLAGAQEILDLALEHQTQVLQPLQQTLREGINGFADVPGQTELEYPIDPQGK